MVTMTPKDPTQIQPIQKTHSIQNGLDLYIVDCLSIKNHTENKELKGVTLTIISHQHNNRHTHMYLNTRHARGDTK